MDDDIGQAVRSHTVSAKSNTCQEAGQKVG